MVVDCFGRLELSPRGCVAGMGMMEKPFACRACSPRDRRVLPLFALVCSQVFCSAGSLSTMPLAASWEDFERAADKLYEMEAKQVSSATLLGSG